MLQGKKILLGISGSIAAYKIPLLVRLLVKAGADVKVVMTTAAADFVSPLVLGTLSKNEVLSALANDAAWTNHVALGRWADVFVLAPLSCNTLAKMGTGLCDNLLLATYLSATCPVIVAPAMDEDMWHHATTRNNLEQLRKQGVQLIPAEHGELASGLVGEGRMAEPETITRVLEQFFGKKNQLAGLKALVTAGPTYEAIDPVRFIGNHSSGKMGFALADELAGRGADVTLVSGPVQVQPAHYKVRQIKVTTAAQMAEAVLQQEFDVAVFAAAVADYTPVQVADQKIKKNGQALTVELKQTVDILKTVGLAKKSGQVVVGFALETQDEVANAQKKLKTKGADLIVLNSLQDKGAGFGVDTNKVSIISKNGKHDLPLQTKKETAAAIIDAVIPFLKK